MSTERQLPGREVAQRLFAAEYDDSSYSYSESDEERAPNYVVAPTGVRINRLFCVGVLTEVAPAGENQLRARIADPTGTFVVYAGQYQPEAMASLESIETPAYVAVTGKANTFEPEDGNRVYTSIRPEEITEVDAQTRERWIVSTAEHTLSRIGTVHAAIESGLTGWELTHWLRESGVDPSFAAGIPIALEQYGTTQAYLADLQRLSLEATRIVAEEIDEVEKLILAPDEGGDGTFEPVMAGPSTADTVTTDVEMGSGGAVETDDEIPSGTGSERPDQKASVSDTNGHAEADTSVADSEITDATVTGSEVTDSNGFESDTVESDTDESDDFDQDDFDPDEFELDEEIREEVESEYGTEFSTAAEVDSASDTETEVESDASEIEAETETADEEFEEVDGDTADEDHAAGEADRASEDADGSAIDLQTLLLDQMDELDDGNGANREALIDQVSEMAAVSDEAVQETIQDALSQGKCYEPGEESLARIDF